MKFNIEQDEPRSNARYKPATLLQLTGISQSDYDAWRRQLDGAPSGHFTDGDILAYRVVRELIFKRVYLRILKRKNTKLIFEACNHSFDLLADHRFVFDWTVEKLLFLGPKDANPKIRAYDLLEIPLSDLIKEHDRTLTRDCYIADPILIEKDVMTLARLRKQSHLEPSESLRDLV